MLDIQENMACLNTGQIDSHQKGEQALQCQDCIDYLNNVRLMNTPMHVGADIEVNKRAAMARVVKHVHEMNLQETFIYMKMLEGMAAQVSLIYNQHLVKSKIADPEELKRRHAEWAQAEKEQRLKNAPVVVKKQLTDWEKAVRDLMHVNVTRADAEAIVNERYAKQNKATGQTYGVSK